MVLLELKFTILPTIRDKSQIKRMEKEYHLLASGGSDFHGANKPDIDIGTGRGTLYVPDHLLDELLR